MVSVRESRLTAAVALIAVIGTSACSGKIKTENLNANEYQKEGYKVDGVVIYPSALFKEISSKRTLVDGSGVMKGTADNGDCTPVSYGKIVQMPDYSRPQRIYYEPGIFESNSFGVGIDHGQLTSVNSQTNPDRGQTAQNLANTLGAVIAATATLSVRKEKRAEGPKAACNEGTVVERYERYVP